MHFLKDLIREIKHRAYGKREFLPRDQVSLYLSFTVHCNYTKICKFTPILSIRVVLNCFYLLILKIF